MQRRGVEQTPPHPKIIATTVLNVAQRKSFCAGVLQRYPLLSDVQCDITNDIPFSPHRIRDNCENIV